MGHPATGPISPEEMHRIASLPFGKATAELRKHDPLYGRQPGEKVKWLVRLTCNSPMIAHTTVEAETEEEARTVAEKIPASKLDFEYDGDGWEETEVLWVDPA